MVEALRDHKNVERALAAAQELQRTATTADIPRLLELLKDKSFFVREAAAWPLSDLGVTGALPDMLQALHMGWQEGHDNDGLSAALSDLAEASPAESALVLLGELSPQASPTSASMRSGCSSSAMASWTHNMPIKLPVRTVTPGALARPAPARPAAYGQRWTDRNNAPEKSGGE